MAPDARNAFIEVMNWMAFERPKDGEPLSKAQLEKWIEEVMQRNRQRKPSATVIPFKKPDTE